MKHLPASAMVDHVTQAQIQTEAHNLVRQPRVSMAHRVALPQHRQAEPVRWCTPAQLTDQDVADWQHVASSAAQANIFARPTMVLPALSALDGDATARLAFVYDDDGDLVGVVPVVGKPLPGRIALPSVGDWGHANGFLSPIAIKAGKEIAFWHHLIAALPRHVPQARCVAIDGLVEHGPAHLGLVAAASALSSSIGINQRIVRAMLATDEDAETYWQASVRAKKRKELRRQWSRLSDHGAVTHGAMQLARGDHGWMDEFLTLEASGWKGKAGSALASSPDTEQFFRRAMERAQADEQVCVAALRLDGRAIAMLITLIDGGAGFSFKTAFNEDYARFSPGVLLQREALGLLRARNLAWIDSCAAQDHPMIDSLWRERRRVVRVSLPLPGLSNRVAYHAVMGAMRAWHALKPNPTTSAETQDMAQ